MSILRDYFLENRKSYIIVGIGYTLVGVLEFVGISSLVPAFAIVLGEDISSLSPKLVHYVNLIGANKIFGLYVLVIIIQMLITLLSDGYFIKKMGEWRTEFITNYVKKVVAADFKYSSNARPGEIEVVMTRNVGMSVKNRQQTAWFFSDCVLSVFYLVTAFYTSFHVLILFLILGGIYFLVNRYLVKVRMDNFASAKEHYFEVAALTSENMRDMRTLLISKKEYFFKKLEQKARAAAINQEINDLINVYLKVSQTPLLLVMLGVWVYLCKSYLDISNAKIMVVLFVFYRSAPRLISVARGYGDILETSTTDVKKDEIYWDKHVSTRQPIKMINNTGPLFSLKNVSVSYGEKLILKNITMEVEANQMIGLVGPSGSGKSTLLDLLTGYISNNSGQFKILNNLIDHGDLSEWARENVSILRTESVLINGSIFENVAYMEESTDKLRVFELLKLVQLENIFHQGAENMITKGGSNLSAGQRQRVLLARTLYKNPKIIILDEPTSNLDVGTEKIINQLLVNMKGKKTILIATHREELLSACDQVFKIEHGEVTKLA